MALQTTITKGVYQDEAGAKKTSLVDIYNTRPDLQKAFPDALTQGTDTNRQLNDWWNVHGVKEYSGVQLSRPEEIKAGITTKPVDLGISTEGVAEAGDASGLDIYSRFGLTPPKDETAITLPTLPESPKAPDYLTSFKTLQEQQGVAGLESQMADYKNQIRMQEDLLRREEESLKAQQGVLSPQVERQAFNERQKANLRIDALKREHDRVVGELNMKNNVISTMMDLTKQDYQTTRQNYEDEFNRSIQMFNIVKGISEDQKSAQEKQTDNARATLNTIYSKITPEMILSPDQKIMINSLELQAGFPLGFYDSIQSIEPEKEIKTIITSDDKTQSTIIYKDGTVRTVSTGLRAEGIKDEILSPSEAATLGVPYGTTETEAYGKVPVKPPTAAQETVAGYASRIEQANPILVNLTSEITKMNFISFGSQIKLPAQLQSAKIQQYMQASRNFINALLRRESGAVISPSEFSEARKQYLPQPGDTEQTLKQKLANRTLVFNSLKGAAGQAYQSIDELLKTNTEDIISQVDDDITQLEANYANREELINALVDIYPELDESEISSRVYTLIQDK